MCPVARSGPCRTHEGLAGPSDEISEQVPSNRERTRESSGCKQDPSGRKTPIGLEQRFAPIRVPRGMIERPSSKTTLPMTGLARLRAISHARLTHANDVVGAG